jgi:hypothetical protein
MEPSDFSASCVGPNEGKPQACPLQMSALTALGVRASDQRILIWINIPERNVIQINIRR